MKKIKLCMVSIALVGIGFMIGYTKTPRTENDVIADIEWAAMESCNIKIASIKKQYK